MSERAALVTGGSSGIGFAIARALAEDGYDVTISARRPDKLEGARESLASDGLDVFAHPADMQSEEELQALVAAHIGRFGRIDVLVNNAGVGIGAPIGDAQTKKIDMQLDVNLRATILMTRECLPKLREAGAEHRKALIVNTASIAGKQGQAWLNVYSAAKFGIVGFSQATQKEVSGDGIQVTALCPAFVDTPMTEFAKGDVAAEDMIRPEDLAEAVRLLLKTSPACLIPELMFVRPGDGL